MTVVLQGFVLPSLGNARMHWAKRARIIAEHRQLGRYAISRFPRPIAMPCIVTLVRVAPRKLDQHDGLPAAFKGVVDGIADGLGIQDNDARVTWLYEQRKGKPKEFCVEIRIEIVRAA